MSTLQEILDSIALHGEQADGSITRIGFSQPYKKALEAAADWMEQAGMQVTTDACMNLQGVLKGSDSTVGDIILGSHLDTVPAGGKYDGAYGVAGAIACLCRMRAQGYQPRHSIQIWGFNMEESSPFGGTFGSRAVAGLVSPAQAGLVEALAQQGLTIQNVLDCKRPLAQHRCYLELHIEQGPTLERQGLDIGVVSGIVGITRYQVTAIGQSNHAGTTRMTDRKDALVGMSRLLLYAEQRARALDDALVVTVGSLTVHPGLASVVPGRVEAVFELRHMRPELVAQLVEEIQAQSKEISDASFSFELLIDKGATSCDPALIRAIDSACDQLHISRTILPSGAGHDANAMARSLPIGMIFVPSREGISHSGLEYSSLEQLEKGVEVLYQTLLDLDAQESEGVRGAV